MKHGKGDCLVNDNSKTTAWLEDILNESASPIPDYHDVVFRTSRGKITVTAIDGGIEIRSDRSGFYKPTIYPVVGNVVRIFLTNEPKD